MLMVGAAAISSDEILKVQPCTLSESLHGQAAPQETGDGYKSSEHYLVDIGTRPAEADQSEKLGETGDLVWRSIVPEAQQQTGASPSRGRTWRRYASTAWMGIKQAGRLFCWPPM